MIICIAKGVNINYKNENNLLSAIHLCIIHADVWMCDLLIQNGADINITDPNGWTPLHHATFLDRISFIILFIKRGANLSTLDFSSRVCFLFRFLLLPHTHFPFFQNSSRFHSSYLPLISILFSSHITLSLYSPFPSPTSSYLFQYLPSPPPTFF